MVRWLMMIMLVALAGGVGGVGGCTSTVRTTDPEPTATEEFLRSQAVARAIRQLEVGALWDRKVFLDATYLTESQQRFLLGELRAHLLNQGVRLMAQREQAEIIVEARSGGVGIDRAGTLVGVPQMVLPTTSGSDATSVFAQFATPELSFYKTIEQSGYGSVAIIGYWADSGEVAAEAGPAFGRAFRTDRWILFLGHKKTGDIVTTEKVE